MPECAAGLFHFLLISGDLISPALVISMKRFQDIMTMLTLSANTPLITWSIVVALILASLVYTIVRYTLNLAARRTHHRGHLTTTPLRHSSTAPGDSPNTRPNDKPNLI